MHAKWQCRRAALPERGDGTSETTAKRRLQHLDQDKKMAWKEMHRTGFVVNTAENQKPPGKRR
jgi:hypothetical protein